jgi:hypothetical protein
VTSWFEKYLEIPLFAGYNINITLHPLAVSNPLCKPGPVFNAITSHAYYSNASYIYRINDDTQLETLWAKKYIRALMSLGVPYGVVGPSEVYFHNRILTHDFVHRLHFEIFHHNYYPVELTDWWMDDWITRVYGKNRTVLMTSVWIKHHIYDRRHRYTVDKTHLSLLPPAIQKGKQQLQDYVRKIGDKQKVDEFMIGSDDLVPSPHPGDFWIERD